MEVNGKIEGLKLFELQEFKDERGAVKKMLTRNHPEFVDFGELYFSLINPGVIKGWKYHKEIHQLMCVPAGDVEIVFYDNREYSKSRGLIQKIIFGDSNYKLIKVPPQLWYSFKCVSEKTAIIANCINQIHDPEESLSIPLQTQDIPYDWFKEN